MVAHRKPSPSGDGGTTARLRRRAAPRTRCAPHRVMAMPRTVTSVMEPDPDRHPARTDGRPRRSIPPLTGMERGGMLLGRVTVMRAVPAPGGMVPVGMIGTTAPLSLPPSRMGLRSLGCPRQTRSRRRQTPGGPSGSAPGDEPGASGAERRRGRIQCTHIVARHPAAVLVAWKPFMRWVVRGPGAASDRPHPARVGSQRAAGHWLHLLLVRRAREPVAAARSRILRWRYAARRPHRRADHAPPWGRWAAANWS
jgi:hypothetical protein